MLGRVASIWRDSSGTEMVEIALVLGVVVLIGLLGYTTLGASLPPTADRVVDYLRK